MACGGVLVQAVGAAQVRDQEDTGGTTLAEIDMTWDWQVFLSDDGSGRTYLQWMMDAWSWTLAVAGCSWVVAVSLGGIMGTLRTLPNSPWLVRLANSGWNCFATSRCWCRSFSGISWCPK
jgi:hypothetical protein